MFPFGAMGSIPGSFKYFALLSLFLLILECQAQTEGDTGYDYNDAYDDDYDDDSVLGLEPTFDVPIVNVTVVQGQTAVLPCSIDYLGKYKVSWVDHHYISLSLEDRRVVDDHRFSIVRPYIKEWNLQIRDVSWQDQGQYRCTVNTDPPKSKMVMLHVKVPATIIDELSSDDVTVQEGDTVVLICNVTGIPRPEVTWYRRPANSKSTEKERIGMKGEMIIIQNVSRYCDDIYECVADNGVPPAQSRQMRVTVEFPPEIRMPNKRIGQNLGRETILECTITAFPHAVNYWEKDGKRINTFGKHRVEAYDEGDHTLTLSLRIHSIQEDDYGKYTCIAANALGRDSESMYLYQVEPFQPKPTYSPTEPAPPPVRVYPRSTIAPPYSIVPQDKSRQNKKHEKGGNQKENEAIEKVPAHGRVTGNNTTTISQSQHFSWLVAALLSLLLLTRHRV